MAVFDKACDVVLGTESGFTANPADPGNWTLGRCGAGVCKGTKYGIASCSYPNEDIPHLTQDAARAIYKRDYWDAVRGDALDPPLALLVFDAAVNNGVGRAARWLQQVAGAHENGTIGDTTIAAVKATIARQGGAAVCAEYLAIRMFFMSRLATWPTFGLGWSRRLTRLPYQSLTLTLEG